MIPAIKAASPAFLPDDEPRRVIELITEFLFTTQNLFLEGSTAYTT
jgi:hypothetical protein